MPQHRDGRPITHNDRSFRSVDAFSRLTDDVSDASRQLQEQVQLIVEQGIAVPPEVTELTRRAAILAVHCQRVIEGIVPILIDLYDVYEMRDWFGGLLAGFADLMIEPGPGGTAIIESADALQDWYYGYGDRLQEVRAFERDRMTPIAAPEVIVLTGLLLHLHQDDPTDLVEMTKQWANARSE